jgi:hypothetical protein
MSSPLALCREGWIDPVVVDTSGVACSWLVDDDGTLSAEVPLSALRDAGLLPFGAVGRWLWWEGPPGAWGGVVTAVEPDAEAGTAELAADTWGFVLDGRVTARVWEAPNATAAGVVHRAVDEAARSWAPLPLTFAFEEGGQAIGLTPRLESLRDLMGDAADQAGQEWRAEPDAGVSFGPRVGADLTATVALVWGADIVGARPRYDLAAVRNVLHVVPDDAPFVRARIVEVRDDASVAAVGVREGVAATLGVATRAAIRTRAEALLAANVAAGATIAFEVSGRSPRVGMFREGDTVAVDLPTLNLTGDVRVMVREWDDDRGTLSVSGDLEVR